MITSSGLVEPDLDCHPRALVAAGQRLASTAYAPDTHLDLAIVCQVAPPMFALGLPDIDDHTIAFLAISNRERVAVPSLATSDGDEREPAGSTVNEAAS